MRRDKSYFFKVISDSGIETWFATREGCEQYIQSKIRNNNEDNAHYNIIESDKKTKRKRKNIFCGFD